MGSSPYTTWRTKHTIPFQGIWSLALVCMPRCGVLVYPGDVIRWRQSCAEPIFCLFVPGLFERCETHGLTYWENVEQADHIPVTSFAYLKIFVMSSDQNGLPLSLIWIEKPIRSYVVRNQHIKYFYQNHAFDTKSSWKCRTICNFSEEIQHCIKT